MTNDYVSIYLNSRFGVDNDPVGFISLFFLFLARILPIIGLSPFFGARVLPNPVKVAFGIALFAVFMPQLTTQVKQPLFFNPALVMLLIKEAFIGFLMGFVISIPFMIVQSTGIIIDHQRGGSSLMVNDPSIQNQSSPLGTLFNFILIYVFFLINGPFLVLDAVSLSYEMVPPDQFLNRNLFNPETPLFQLMSSILNRTMVIATQLAAPALIAILMTDVFLGIANRLAPQVQITFLGMPLKSLLGLTVIFVGWQLLVNQMMTESYSWIRLLNDMVQMLTPA